MLFRIARIGRDPVVSYASEELKRCLGVMDPSLEILLLTYPAYRPELPRVLWIGQDPAFASLLPAVEDPALDDAIAVETEGLKGFITGANPRAVLIAAFRWLRELGAAWVRPGPDGELLPHCDVSVSRVHVKEAPACRHRGVCIEGAVSLDHVEAMIDWLPRVGMNAYFNQFQIPATFYERWYGPHLRRTQPDEAVTAADAEGMRDATAAEIKKRGLLYHAAGHGWTCEPFGIAGTGWDADREHPVPEASKPYLALVNGKRELWGNIPLNTNLCYSTPAVRETIGQAVADYCAARPEVDYVQVWLADGRNNHCECPECVKKRPSDWYVDLLNEIDARMTAKNVPAKVVFLMYCDLYWQPVESRLNNPDRFVLMFAPITRTYTRSLTEAPAFDDARLPDYVRNKTQLPRSVEENLAWLARWKRFFPGDSFDFDYHYMWDQHRDPAHLSMNKVLFEDMKGLRSLGLNGMMSCQNQRVWLPTGFGMAAMAVALWNSAADWAETAADYFTAAFGPDGPQVFAYLTKLSKLLCPPYFRGETDRVSPETAASLAQVPAFLDGFSPVIAKNLTAGLPAVQRRSWEYLDWHARYIALLAPAAQARAEGRDADAAEGFRTFCAYVRGIEPEVADALDVFELTGTLARFFR